MSGPLTKLGITNASWGDCGFTSAFYAMWEMEKQARPRLINAPKPFSVIAEIKTYLRMLQAEGNQAAIKAIEEFCQSFGPPFDTFTVEKYCDRVSDSVGLVTRSPTNNKRDAKAEQAILADPLFSIGMPPNLVVDYLKRMWGYNATVIEVPPGSDPGGNAIIGMNVLPGTKDPGGNVVKTLYNLLVHYMYRHNGLIYSWGAPAFPTIEAAALGGADWAKGWQIGWVIQIGSKV